MNETRIVPTGGCHDCGGRCVLKVHVKDGVAVRVETDDGEEPQLRACARGRAYRQQVYSPDRLRVPLRRIGPRGEGQFEPVTWDEALNTVAENILRIRNTYGPEAILTHVYSGPHASTFHSGFQIIARFNRMFGGRNISGWGGASAEGGVFANRATFGTLTTGNSRDDLVNSRLIILWGANPAESVFGTNTCFHLIQAREAGARIVVIDPRYSNTVAILADRWIPIRPGTDAAMMIAMAYVMISENLHNQQFLDRYTIGFDQFKDYVMGADDGISKTPQWAESKTGVPAADITALAREYATTYPAALIPGWAPGRSARGEQYHRTASTLAAMTGNVGISGGNAAGFERAQAGSMIPPGWNIENPDASYEKQVKALDVRHRLRSRPHIVKLWDAILKGKAGGYPGDIKMAYIVGGNPLNQFPNINKGVEALNKLEFIVVHEQFMTATARYADILLPVTTLWERNDFARPWVSGPYFISQNKVIDPLPDVRSDIDIFRALLPKIGVSDPSLDIPEEEGIRQLVATMGDVIGEIPDFEAFKRAGVHKMNFDGPQIAFKEQIEDPLKHPFPTPSGKIEIYCRRLADVDNPEVSPIPRYIESWEGPGDPLIQKYPLQMVTYHHKGRAHSIFHTNPWLREIEPQRVWINAADAQSRGIGDEDEVKVFNDRGVVVIRARVTERIMPGVVAMGEGAWYQPGSSGVDRGGNPNVLIRDQYSPGGAFPGNTCLVQVERFA
ncbi:MAG: molybdopterin-dependent oxidoreductase [Dehalococcoidia bacterium]|nr:molybdopterin-dependent oxidoreductase [Dehalococcoidia bacterium]